MIYRIEFDRAKRERLRKEYEKALKEGKDTFDFEGYPIVVNFAKYLLEYLDTILK